MHCCSGGGDPHDRGEVGANQILSLIDGHHPPPFVAIPSLQPTSTTSFTILMIIFIFSHYKIFLFIGGRPCSAAYVDRQHDRQTIGRLIVRAIVRTIVRAIVRANGSQARYSLQVIQQCFSTRQVVRGLAPVRGSRKTSRKSTHFTHLA